MSENAKLGPMSATYVSQATCPTSCPFLGKGCYAESKPTGFTTSKLNDSPVTNPVEVAQLEAAEIKKLSGRFPLRVHVVGDVGSPDAAKIVALAMIGHASRKGQPAWTYSHAWKSVPRSFWGKAQVWASCETDADVEEAWRLGYAACRVVPAHPDRKAYQLGDKKVLPCPHESRPEITCSDCLMCARTEHFLEKKIVLGFRAHGAKQKVVRQTLGDLSSRRFYQDDIWTAD